MPGIRELLPNTGVPQDNYIVVPHSSYAVVWLEGAKGSISHKDDAKTNITKVTKDNAAKIAENVARNHTSGHKSGGDLQKELLARMNALINSNPGQTFAIFGRKPGFGKIEFTADKTSFKADVGVVTQATYNISFRFLEHKDGNKTVPDTSHAPKEADSWIAALNRIYSPQANIIFDLKDAKWITTDTAAPQPMTSDFFLKSIAVKPDDSKKGVTMHLVGDWDGGGVDKAKGSYWDGTGIAVVNDKPKQDEIPAGIDPFMLTMAHELLHFVRDKRGMPTGHPDRDMILMSNKIQTLRIDKQMSMDINMPG